MDAWFSPSGRRKPTARADPGDAGAAPGFAQGRGVRDDRAAAEAAAAAAAAAEIAALSVRFGPVGVGLVYRTLEMYAGRESVVNILVY